MKQKKLLQMSGSVCLVVLITLLLTMACAPAGVKPQVEPQVTPQVEPQVKPIELIFETAFQPNSLVGKALLEWKARLEQETKGKVTVKVAWGNVLGVGTAAYDAVTGGTVDISGLPAPMYLQKLPLTDFTSICQGLGSAEVATHVVWDLYDKYPEMRKEIGVGKLLNMYALSPFQLITKKPVRALEDIKGSEIGTGSGEFTMKLIKSLGASPIPQFVADVYPAMEKGVINKKLSNISSLKDSRLAEVSSYTTEIALCSVTVVTLMNQKKWDSLPPDVQKVIDGLVKWWSYRAAEIDDKYVLEVKEWAIKEHGHQFIKLQPDELKRWYDAAAPVRDEWASKLDAKGLPGKAFINDALQLAQKYNK